MFLTMWFTNKNSSRQKEIRQVIPQFLVCFASSDLNFQVYIEMFRLSLGNFTRTFAGDRLLLFVITVCWIYYKLAPYQLHLNINVYETLLHNSELSLMWLQIKKKKNVKRLMSAGLFIISYYLSFVINIISRQYNASLYYFTNKLSDALILIEIIERKKGPLFIIIVYNIWHRQSKNRKYKGLSFINLRRYASIRYITKTDRNVSLKQWHVIAKT